MDRIHDELTYLAERPETYPAGRRCHEPGCITVLSVYNPEDYCGAHEGRHVSMSYGGMNFAVCDHCHSVYEARYFLGRKGSKDTVCRSCRHKEALERLRGPGAITHKVCTNCGESKPRTAQFWGMQANKGGNVTAQGCCRTCKSKRDRERYQARVKESA
jgi:hypothetical protein